MKGYLIPIILLSLILFLCFWANAYSVSILENTLDDINTCIDSIKASDWQSSADALHSGMENLNKHLPMLQIFINHQNLNEIRFSLVRTDAYITMENADEALAEAESLISRLKTTVDSDKSTLSNLL